MITVRILKDVASEMVVVPPNSLNNGILQKLS